MTKVIFKKLKPKRSARVKRGRSGKGAVTYLVDPGSQTLPNDIQYVFRRSVSKARKENKRILGSTDLVPPSA